MRLWLTTDRLGCVELWSEEPGRLNSSFIATGAELAELDEACSAEVADHLGLEPMGQPVELRLVKREGRLEDGR